MMQNNLNQLQNLLLQVNNHINQINAIIIQMNNLINQINNPINVPMLNQMNNLMNSMNNYMNFGNQINYNNNIDYSFKENKEIMNITFDYMGHEHVLLQVEGKETINELINLYLQKINMPHLMNNYEDKLCFNYNSKLLENLKEKKVKEILNNASCINVIDKNLFK